MWACFLWMCIAKVPNHQKLAGYATAFRRSWARIQLVNTFFENQYFLHTHLLKSSFDSRLLLLGIAITHRKGTWAKLNARHLGTWLWWLLMGICFFFVLYSTLKVQVYREDKEKLSVKPRKQTVVKGEGSATEEFRRRDLDRNHNEIVSQKKKRISAIDSK